MNELPIEPQPTIRLELQGLKSHIVALVSKFPLELDKYVEEVVQSQLDSCQLGDFIEDIVGQVLRNKISEYFYRGEGHNIIKKYLIEELSK